MVCLCGDRMEFERVKMSAEMVGIVGVWLTMLLFVWNLSQDMGDFRTEVASEISGFRAEVSTEINGLRAEMFSEIAKLNEHLAHVNERLAHVEGLLQGYIERPQTEKMAATD